MPPPRRRSARPAPLDSAETGRPAIGDVGAGERAATATGGSFGPWLKGQREARGVTIAEIAESSKISVRYLEALERDRFDVLPAPVFVRGFLREYARVVGLDADEVVNLFLVAAPRTSVERKPVSAGAQLSGWPHSTAGSSSLGRGLLAALLVLLVLGVAAGLSYWAARRSSAVPAAVSSSEATVLPEPSKSVASPPESPPVTAVAVTSGPLSQAGEVVQPAIQPASDLPLSAAVSVPTTSAPRAGELGPMIVVLAFQQDCWVETRVDGGRRASELKAGGETLTIEARESIVLTLGNALAVRAELNGRPLTLPVDASRLLREFRIDRSLIADPNPSGRRQPSEP